MIITNYKLKDFLKQDAETIGAYIVALQYLKPKQTEKQIIHLKLKHVEFIKTNLYKDQDDALIKIVARVQGVKVEEVYNFDIITFFRIIASVKLQTDRIFKAEENSLRPSEVNFKWLAVDGDLQMSKFGIYNTLEDLADGDGLKYKKWLNEKYSHVFTILYMKKTARELKKAMDKIKTKTD